MADTKTIGKAATEAPLPVPAVAHPSPGEAGPGSASPAPADWQSKEAQVLLQAAKNAPAELANLPHTVAETLPRKLAPMEAYLNAELPVLEALPLQDLIFGGGVLVAVVIVQAIGIRLLTARFEKRALDIEKGPAWWSVDLLLGFTVFRMLGLHLASIVLWSAALFTVASSRSGVRLHASSRFPTPPWVATASCRRNGICSHRSLPSRGCSPLPGRPASW